MKLKALIGKNVKYYRYRENLIQEQLAEKTKSSVNYIGRLERGQHNPSVDKLEKVASALNIEPYELFIQRNDIDNLPVRVNLKPKKYHIKWFI